MEPLTIQFGFLSDPDHEQSYACSLFNSFSWTISRSIRPCLTLTCALHVTDFVDFIIIDYRIPRTIGVSIPMKATFFMTYIMVDGWAGIAGEILRLKPLVIYHLKNMFLVKTERDREKAMDPGSVDFPETLPSLQLYFLLGIVYAVVTPILLPFILVFFALAYLVYRHQVSASTNSRKLTRPV